MLPPSPSPAPSPAPSPSTASFSVPFSRPPPPSSPSSSSSPLAFSPPLIAMVVVVAAAFIAATYSRHVILLHRRFRRFRRRRRLLFRPDIESPSSSTSSVPPSDGFHVSSPFGLHDSVIKSIPLSTFSLKNNGAVLVDCAVCLLEFEDADRVRTLPACGHAFHVDCIDVWLRSHANCPLCRAGITLRPEPIMAGRIRPSLEDIMVFEPPLFMNLLQDETTLEPLPEEAPENHAPPAVCGEIQLEQQEDDLFVRRDFLMKRSYSFSFERNLGSERLAFEPATASPWRYRKGFWGKRAASPFGSVGKSRMFSFRYYHRGMKSPFFRRRGGFFPLSSERGGSSSRRSKSMASPMFMRSSAAGTFFSSSRMRSGDPEALLSPDRFNRR